MQSEDSPLSLARVSAPPPCPPQVGTLQEDMNGLRSEIQRLKQEVKKRDSIIASLKTDIEGLKREIQERDATIQDKVGCMGLEHYVVRASFPGCMCPYVTEIWKAWDSGNEIRSTIECCCFLVTFLVSIPRLFPCGIKSAAE